MTDSQKKTFLYKEMLKDFLILTKFKKNKLTSNPPKIPRKPFS